MGCLLGRRPHPATAGYLTCTPCSERLFAALDEIVDRYDQLDPTPSISPDDSPRPKPGSKPPLNLHIVAMTDRRTTPTRPGDPQCAPAVLHSWVRMICEDTGASEPDDLTLPTIVSWLHRWTDHITRQPWVDEFAAEVRDLLGQLKAATGEPRPRPVAVCMTVDCDTPLYEQPGEIRLDCPRCKRPYDGPDLIKLRIANEQREAS